VVVGAAVREHRDAEAGRMTERMDKAILALQAAATARRLYGLDHAVVKRQVDLSAQMFESMLAQRPALRVVRLEQTMMFEDAELPSARHLAEVLAPRLTAHGIEWLEFRRGLARPELVTLLDQLERAPTDLLRGGTAHIRVGRIGQSESATPDSGSVLSMNEQVSQFKDLWGSLRGDGRPDQRLNDLVESIRLAVSVGADVCKQLAEVKSHDEYTFVHTVNVAILSAALGESVGMKPNQVFDLTLAALLHDVGKQRTPLAILNRPGKLDDGERRQMELHTTAGAAILLSRPGVPDVAPIVAFEHHANIDGSGYPRLRRARAPISPARSSTSPTCSTPCAPTGPTAAPWTMPRSARSSWKGRASHSTRPWWTCSSTAS